MQALSPGLSPTVNAEIVVPRATASSLQLASRKHSRSLTLVTLATAKAANLHKQRTQREFTLGRGRRKRPLWPATLICADEPNQHSTRSNAPRRLYETWNHCRERSLPQSTATRQSQHSSPLALRHVHRSMVPNCSSRASGANCAPIPPHANAPRTL